MTLSPPCVLVARLAAENTKGSKRHNEYPHTLGPSAETGDEALDIATVLVTVKTYPCPSDRYGESVCVAGVRLDRDVPEWIGCTP